MWTRATSKEKRNRETIVPFKLHLVDLCRRKFWVLCADVSPRGVPGLGFKDAEKEHFSLEKDPAEKTTSTRPTSGHRKAGCTAKKR